MENMELTEKIIGAAIEVYKKLGPGFIELIYENALAIELKKRNITFQRQSGVMIKYDNEIIGEHKLDFIIENEIIVELKAVKFINTVHFAVVRSYLKAANKKHGLILNFSRNLLEVKRVIYEEDYNISSIKTKTVKSVSAFFSPKEGRK